MKICIPKERKANEKRIAITPQNVEILIKAGADIYIEKDAGLGSGFTNEEYISSGAKLLSSINEIWETADILLKVKEPAPEEYNLMREGQIVFSFLHPAASEELTKEMLDKKIIGLDYDLVQTDDGKLPILEPMSMIAGNLAVHCGAEMSLSQNGGQGILLEKFLESSPANVLIIGAGVSGTEAMKRALKLSANVTVLDINKNRLKDLKSSYPEITTKISSKDTLEEELKRADLIIGAVLIPGAKAPRLITNDMLKSFKKNAVFVDISIDQGGISESSKPTKLSSPSYIVDNVIHYCVSNMPAMVPRTASIALSNRTLPYLMTLINTPLDEILKIDNPLSRSLVCYKGDLTNELVGEAFGIEWRKFV